MKKNSAIDDKHCNLLWEKGSSTTIAATGILDFTDQITVEAWVDAAEPRAEVFQALVSQWTPPDSMDRFAAYDAAGTDGLNSTGYFGAVFDGRYVYFVPEQHGDSSTHGVVLRYDTHRNFKDRGAYQAYDAGMTDGLETRGFYGAVCDGRYVYFVPRQIGVDKYHSRILRLDTQGEFKDPASWAAFDVGEEHSQQSAAFDGRYIYFCPGFHGDPAKEDQYSGRVIRYDTKAEFKERASYTSIDISEFLGDEAACFDGGAFDGRFVYFVPLYTKHVVRYDTRGEFHDRSSWQVFDGGKVGMGMNVGAVFDGKYLYFCAYTHGNIVRFDTRGDFLDPAFWSSYNAEQTGGVATSGFDGGFFDGRFVYFQPFKYIGPIGPGKREVKFHSHYLRYDPSKPFDDEAAWQAYDASRTDELHSVGYNGGAFDGRYFYAAPWQQGRDPQQEGQFITHGIVLRCDTLGENGSFSLRYCDYGHNGGLNAAVPGPSFVVNTENGALYVASHKALKPGKHHIAGVYDGKTVKLYVDGELAASQSGSGRIVASSEPVAIGHIHKGLGAFEGKIARAQIFDVAKTKAELDQAYTSVKL